MPLPDGLRANFANDYCAMECRGFKIWKQTSNKAARFISSDTKALNLELRFSGSFAFHPQIRPTMLGSRRSAADTSRKDFDQDNCG
jgi:hypothetical protein